jgi:cytochrome c oxidase subunit II
VSVELSSPEGRDHAQPVSAASPRRRLGRVALVVTGFVLLLAGCASDAPLDTFSPEGPQAQTIDDLAVPVFIVAGVVFFLVLGFLLAIAVKFRDKGQGVEGAGDADDPDFVFPKQTHGVVPLELGWTILPAALLAVIGIFTVATIFDLAEQPEGDDVISITVIGQQWWWEYQYDTNGDGEADIITANEMVIPAGVPIDLSIESRDVIHSFWIPALNGKKDAVPGRSHDLTMEADEPGQYRGQCTEYCGLSHANMRMRVYALDQADYDTWVENQLAEAPIPEEGTDAAAGQQAFIQACSNCHVINGLEPEDFEGAQQVSGAAPNLTHFMSRTTFAGSLFDTYIPPGPEDQADDLGYLEILEEGEFNRAVLEEWLRNPPAMKPMAPEPNQFSDGVGRGMPDLNLSETQIDQLVAYLETLE